MTSGDRRLQRVGSKRASERLRTFEPGEPATDEEWVPLPAVLIEEEDRLAGRSHARPRARRLDLHEGNEAMGLRLAREQLRDEAAEAERIQAKGRSHPVVARGRGVALVEYEIDHLEHRRETSREIACRRHLERDVRRGQGSFGTDDPLRDGRL